MYENHLIYGKDETEQIVSLEVKNDEVYAYFNDGTLLKQPAMYFICATYKIDKDFIRLEGNNDFRYVRTFNTQKEFSEARKKLWRYKDSIYSVYKPEDMHMTTRGSTLFKGLKIDEVSRLGFDIESDGLERHKDSTVFMISNTFRDGKGNETKKVFREDNFNSVKDMLDAWCDYVNEIDPTLMVGHNVIGYDLPYLEHVANLNGTTLRIGRDGSNVKFASRPRNYRVDGGQTWEYKDVRIFGRHVVDTMFLSVKYDIGRNFPGWGLKGIIEHLGLVKDGREFYDASQIYKNWSNPVEREKIVQYGIDDGDDALNLYEMMAPSFFYLTQSIPKSFQEIINTASGSWINSLLVRSYLQHFKSIPKANEKTYVAGGISFGMPGVYSNVFKVDVKSMYPTIMLHIKASPKGKDPDNHFYKMVDFFTKLRFEQKAKYKETKDKMYDDLQAASKIYINSAYGTLGTPGLNFNDFILADRITGVGRAVIRKCLLWSSGKDIEYYMPEYELEKDRLYLDEV